MVMGSTWKETAAPCAPREYRARYPRLGTSWLSRWGLMLYVRQLVPGAVMRSAAFLALLVGLIAPVSRGPWVGMAAIVLLYFATGPRAMSNLAKLGVAGAILTAGNACTPAGERSSITCRLSHSGKRKRRVQAAPPGDMHRGNSG